MDHLRVVLTAALAVFTCAGLGAFIDFVIGPRAQKKVLEWLELNWYRVADLQWRKLGTEEAAAYVRLFDRLFGRRFFSLRRLAAVAIALLVALLLATVLAKGPGIVPNDIAWMWTAVSAFTFSLSLSITRAVSKWFASLHIKTPTGNLLVLCALIFAHLLILSLWHRIVWVLLELSTVWLYYPAATRSFGIHWLWHETLVALQAADWSGIGSRSILETAIHGDPTPYDINGVPERIAGYLSYWGNLARLAVLGVFVASHFFEWLFVRPFLFLWGRLIENGKPVFAVLFSGAASVASLAIEIARRSST